MGHLSAYGDSGVKWTLLLIPFLFGFSRIHLRYDDPKVAEEFVNAENSLQDRQFRVVTTTPALADLRDGEFVIFSSTAVKILIRQGQEIYAVQVSCITVRR